jgi:hypothetical protein
MKEIKPISIWHNGQMINATIFDLVSISDNLSTIATFYYCLYSESEIKLTEGNLTMEGFDYEAYCTSPDSNAYAYEWGASKLNITLI